MYLSHACANKIAMINEMFIVGENDDKNIRQYGLTMPVWHLLKRTYL